MPSVRLQVAKNVPVVPCDYREPDGTPRRHPLLRLTAQVVIVPPPGTAGPRQNSVGLVDTGAWVSALRPDAWQSFAADGLVERLHPPAGVGYTSSLAGVTTSCGFGRIWVHVVGPPRDGPGLAVLGAVPVLVQLLDDPRLNDKTIMHYPILFGLHGGVLDGRRLVREPLTPRPTPAVADEKPVADAGPAFGQDWFLET